MIWNCRVVFQSHCKWWSFFSLLLLSLMCSSQHWVGRLNAICPLCTQHPLYIHFSYSKGSMHIIRLHNSFLWVCKVEHHVSNIISFSIHICEVEHMQTPDQCAFCVYSIVFLFQVIIESDLKRLVKWLKREWKSTMDPRLKPNRSLLPRDTEALVLSGSMRIENKIELKMSRLIWQVDHYWV